jgi:eukaryotic-like serine/threonine-protein kinase
MDITSVERPGTQIGCYKLLRVLGEGGMGMVYLAEQQGEIRRAVALKVVKAGMDSARVFARFEVERQALALLDHPNIAHVYDAGTTDGGRPYFAMEYVKGIPITEYCDRYKLSTQERVRLFIPLCQGIQHAHHKGIVHRDVKPSNVLVMLHDDKPVPKIIDFGVAKALNQRLTEKTMFTEQGQFLGTPEYMSPEQVELTGLDVDARTDIYSLGVLLYELLTGYTPFDSQELRSNGHVEMQRVICEKDPVKPSTKLTTLGGRLEDIAKHRSATADQLQKSVRGDLDWIVMKTLEKDRTRRYETANGLAVDLERHLNNEPVFARPPSKLYRFQKLARRNRAVFAAVAVVAAVLVLGSFVSTWQAIRATEAKRAERRTREQAQAEERTMRQLAYASDISLAQQALAMNDLGRARRLLDDHRPGAGEVDLRGWEWRYLWQECQSDALGELWHYPHSAYSVAYSPNGKTLAVAGSDQGFVEIWDVPGRERITVLQPTEGSLVAFSPRGDLLATDAGNQIRIWQTDTWSPVRQLTLPESDEALVLKFSPDGARLACISHSDKVHEVIVWEVDQWTIAHRIRGARFQSFWSAMDFSPDSKALAIGDADRRIQVVNLADGSADFNIPEAHSEGITALAWSPTGSVIASGSGFSGGSIRLWDAASGRRLQELEGHTSWICELVFSADGLWLYSASGDQTIRIWDMKEGKCSATLHGSSHEVYGLALSPDGATLASACKDGVVAFWSALPHPEEEQPLRIALGRRYGWPAFAPDGRILAAPRWGIVTLFDLATLQEVERLPALGADVLMVAYSPDGTLLASQGDSGKVRVWSCTEHRLLQELDGHNRYAYLLRFQADGRRLLSVDAAGKVIWWDTLTWQPSRSFVVEIAAGCAVSPNGRLLARGDADAWRWFSAETGDLLETTPGPPHSASRVAFSGDGSQVAGTSEYGSVTLWNPSLFKPIATFQGHMQGAHGVAFSPDGHRLATGGGTAHDVVKLWDLSTYRELLTLAGQGSWFLVVAFSPDGQWLAACGYHGEFHLWHAPSWDQIEAAERTRPSGQAR